MINQHINIQKMKIYFKFLSVVFGYLISIYFLFLFFNDFNVVTIGEQANLSLNLFNYILA